MSYDGDASSELDAYAPFHWLEVIESGVHYKPNAPQTEKRCIGSSEARLIRREEIRPMFYSEMEKPCREEYMLAFGLFDRYGRLKPEWKDHPIRRGSGIWQQELDKGDILLIEQIIIDQDFRRQGLGRQLTLALLDKTRSKTAHPFFAIVMPAYLRSCEKEKRFQGLSQQQVENLLPDDEDIAYAFYRSLGFRRIGSSRWLGYASDSNHPSRYVAMDSDFDRPEVQHESAQPELAHLIEMKEMDDVAALALLEQFLTKRPDDDHCWLATDKQGNTVMHSAARNAKPKCIRWLLAKAFAAQMQATRNNDGDTPLDALFFKLEETRTQREFRGTRIDHVSDCFKGQSKAAVACIARLNGKTALGELERKRLTYGCTCGECLSGFISPRMAFTILNAAETSHEMLGGFQIGKDGSDWVDWHKQYLTHLPDAVRNNLKTNKSMRQGFANLFGYIAACLKAKKVPTEKNISEAWEASGEWPPATANFLRRGGTVAAAANAAFEHTLLQDELIGDGWLYDEFVEQIASLPACRNDKEYGFVAGTCGYKRVSAVTTKEMLDPGPGVHEGDFLLSEQRHERTGLDPFLFNRIMGM